jgi:hypothetical protein
MITAGYDPETWARIKQAVNHHANQLFHAGRNDPGDRRTRATSCSPTRSPT